MPHAKHACGATFSDSFELSGPSLGALHTPTRALDVCAMTMAIESTYALWPATARKFKASPMRACRIAAPFHRFTNEAGSNGLTLDGAPNTAAVAIEWV